MTKQETKAQIGIYISCSWKVKMSLCDGFYWKNKPWPYVSIKVIEGLFFSFWFGLIGLVFLKASVGLTG